MKIMERLLDLVFWIIGLCDVRSSDPILAAFKHARRAMIICAVAQFPFLALAFAFAPEGATGVIAPMQIAEQMRYYIGNGFAIAALGCITGMVWFTIRMFHIYVKPEQYLE